MVMQTQETLSDKYIRILRDGFVSMDMAQNILVIKTVSGMAMAVAAALDAIHFHEIVGALPAMTPFCAPCGVWTIRFWLWKNSENLFRTGGHGHAAGITCKKSGIN